MGLMDKELTLDISEHTVIVLDSPQSSGSRNISLLEEDWIIPETVRKIKVDTNANQISPVPLLLVSDDEDDLEKLEKEVLSSSWSRSLARSYIKSSADVSKKYDLDISPLKSRHTDSYIDENISNSYVERNLEHTQIEVDFDLTMESTFNDDYSSSSQPRSHSRHSPLSEEEQVSFDLTDDSCSFQTGFLQHDTITLTSSDPLEDEESHELYRKHTSHRISQFSKSAEHPIQVQTLISSNDENEPEVENNTSNNISTVNSTKVASLFEKKSRTVSKSLQEVEFERVRKELAKRKKSENSLKTVDKADKEHEKLLKKLERESKKLEKQQQKEEKEREKAKERQLREVNNLRLDKLDCCQEMIANIDESIINTPERAGITVGLEEILVEVNSKVCQIPHSIELQRRIKAEFDHAQDMWIPITPKIKEENTILIILPWENFIERVGKHELYNFIFEIREVHPGKRIVVILEGLNTFVKKRKRLESRKFVNQVLTQTTDEEEESTTRKKRKPKKGDVSTGPEVEEVEDQLVWLQMVGKCLIVHTKSIEETNSMVAVLIKDISTIPYKKRNTQLKFCIDGQIKSGTTAKEVWELMLQQIHLVTPNVARSIIYEYPTLKCLYDAYKSVNTPEEGQLMLQDVTIGRHSVSSRRLGPALSKRIYQFFMGQDPNYPIS